MAQINMNGRQSFLLNDIKQHIQSGGNVTHILNVKISRQGTNDVGNQIRQHLFQRINNCPIQCMVNGMNVTITWRSNATSSSAYYHADVMGMLGDTAVQRHTEILLTRLLAALNERFDNVFRDGATGLAFLVSKPLVREVALVNNDIPGVVKEDEELDETEEQD